MNLSIVCHVNLRNMTLKKEWIFRSCSIFFGSFWCVGPCSCIYGGSRYFVIFIDDFSRYTWIYEVRFRTPFSFYLIEPKGSDSRSDNAREYTSDDFETILKQHGTLPHLYCPGTSQENGVAERKNRTGAEHAERKRRGKWWGDRESHHVVKADVVRNADEGYGTEIDIWNRPVGDLWLWNQKKDCCYVLRARRCWCPL